MKNETSNNHETGNLQQGAVISRFSLQILINIKISDLLKGKKVNVMTDAKVVVQLEIETVEENHHSRDLEPATRENDWWPKTEDWTTFDVKFTNGFFKSYRSLSEIDVVS